MEIAPSVADTRCADVLLCPGLTEELIDCSGGEEISLESGTARKLDALFAALRRHRSARTVVFCNKIETCRVVENSIRRSPDGAKYKVIAKIIRSAHCVWLMMLLCSVCCRQ